MKRVFSIILIIVFICSLFACKSTDKPLAAAELLDLGEKYLLEMGYEQAVVYFTQLIEVEPMNPRGYTGVAEAYLGLGQPDNAISILTDGKSVLQDNIEIERMLDALHPIEDELTLESTEYPTESESHQIPDNTLAQGEITRLTGRIEYKYFCVDGIPKSMGTIEENGIIETIMAYMRQVDDNGDWSEWEPAPHYWAGLLCTNCGEFPSDGSMPEWFGPAFTHAWSGEWQGTPSVFANNDSD